MALRMCSIHRTASGDAACWGLAGQLLSPSQLLSVMRTWTALRLSFTPADTDSQTAQQSERPTGTDYFLTGAAGDACIAHTVCS